jgi:hypothetical protein
MSSVFDISARFRQKRRAGATIRADEMQRIGSEARVTPAIDSQQSCVFLPDRENKLPGGLAEPAATRYAALQHEPRPAR